MGEVAQLEKKRTWINDGEFATEAEAINKLRTFIPGAVDVRVRQIEANKYRAEYRLHD